MQRNDFDEHTVHRLEAFSDIVIGFSLAQLGASLAFPRHGIDLVNNPIWIFSFLFAFSMVCLMWFFHHRLFSHYFVPKAFPIVLNFVWLGLVVLLVFFARIYVQLDSDLVAYRLYFGGYFLAYGTLGIQYVIGVRNRGTALGPVQRSRGVRGAAFMFLWAIPGLWCFIATFIVPDREFLGMLIGVGFMLTGIISGLLGRYFRMDERRLQSA